MITIGEKKVQLPCPESVLAEDKYKCTGKIEITILFLRKLESRGPFIISVLPTSIICNKCKRKFRVSELESGLPNQILFHRAE